MSPWAHFPSNPALFPEGRSRGAIADLRHALGSTLTGGKGYGRPCAVCCHLPPPHTGRRNMRFVYTTVILHCLSQSKTQTWLTYLFSRPPLLPGKDILICSSKGSLLVLAGSPSSWDSNGGIQCGVRVRQNGVSEALWQPDSLTGYYFWLSGSHRVLQLPQRFCGWPNVLPINSARISHQCSLNPCQNAFQ